MLDMIDVIIGMILGKKSGGSGALVKGITYTPIAPIDDVLTNGEAE